MAHRTGSLAALHLREDTLYAHGLAVDRRCHACDTRRPLWSREVHVTSPCTIVGGHLVRFNPCVSCVSCVSLGTGLWLAGRASRIDGGSESCGIKCNNQTRRLRVDSTCAGQYANQEAQRPNGQCQTQIAQRGVRRRVLSVRLTRLFLQRLPLA